MRTTAMCLIAASLAAHAQAQCSSFQPAYPGLNGAVRVLAPWDPDGSGPLPPRLVAGGEFTWNEGGGSQDYIAWWDGTQWSNLGWGPDAPVNAITTWDSDGDGPLPPQLIIGGEFPDIGADSTGAITVNYIARWDGEAWQPLGTGADGPVDALTTWDPDGAGPLPAELVAAGRFTHIGGVWTGGVAHWDGTAWHSFGWGIEGSGAALTVWDPDGDGPEIPNLVVGGSFLDAGAASTGGVDVNNIARWDGAAWRAIGPGLPSPVNTMIAFDLGSGLQLLAGGSFGVTNWTGAAWESFGRGFVFDHSYCYSDGSEFGRCDPAIAQGTALKLMSWDPDGPGQLPPQLLATGTYTYVSCAITKGFCHSQTYVEYPLAFWTGYSFAPIAGNMRAIATFDAGDANPASQLVTASYGPPPTVRPLSFVYPVVELWPAPVAVHTGETASFVLEATNGDPSYRWYNKVLVLHYGPGGYPYYENEFAPMSDGVAPGGSIVSGSTTPLLHIQGVTHKDATLYQCRIMLGSCPLETSPSVALTIAGTCTADFDGDGDIGTDADIEAFFACLSGTCCPTCGPADFNNDGDVGTDQDIDSFFRVLAGGHC